MKTLTYKDIRYLVIHCSATRSTQNYSQEQLLSDHLGRGFSGIGYHFYITRDGHLHRTRSLNKPGAHALGHNHESFGICYEGGLDAKGRAADTRTKKQCETLERLLKALRLYCPKAQIVGHRDLSRDLNKDGLISPNEWTKECPSFDAGTAYTHL